MKEINIKNLLLAMDFIQKNDMFIKQFPKIDAYLKVDFKKKEIIYPEDKQLVINEHQTCNFSQDENFVVLECVNRLFEKEYKPRHITLEPKWKLGLGASGGRADILISDNNNNPLLLIECKTHGRAFKKAWKETLIDGDQLFSYAQQIPNTSFLCLYTSFLESNEKIKYISHIISHRDNEKILNDNTQLKSFKDAGSMKERFKVWHDTYLLEYATKGIFEKNIQPYHIGKDKYTLADLQPTDASNKEGKYHDFRTILRKYNISGREKAFDVLVNLFLCKIVDETYNKDDLKFYWKGIAYDSYYELIDRLQELYTIGMEQFLSEEVVYISNEEIENAFWSVKQNRNATKKQIKKYFRQLKFYTNNDFGLLDVHNEKLFYQNAKVLLEMVIMWQDLKIKTNHHNQFLGDMFEFFLDNGIKQSEGQFFTPMPVCKFVLSSLPLENILFSNSEPPKVLDYACGAGHFLTEYASQVTPLLENSNTKNSQFYNNIYGIEKEYRLSKVAKLSSFMYGHEGINILHDDALSDNPNVTEESFDILIANPPFSVDGFLETLEEDMRSKYELTDTVKDISKNSQIECFFIERTKMLLSKNAVAGIVFDASMLSNSDNTSIRTREIILKYFDIISIVELGRDTFSKTPANTITLFLRRKKDLPEPSEHYMNRVKDWFSTDETSLEFEIYQDTSLIKSYCLHNEIEIVDYMTLLNGEPSDELLKHELFMIYKEDFNTNKICKDINKKPITKKFTEDDKNHSINKLFIQHIQDIEQEKLYFFIMALANPQKVLVVNSPTESSELKKFRGYSWRGGKGSEGIVYNGGLTVDHIITPLYNPKNRKDKNKLSYFIQENFLGNNIDENQLEKVLPNSKMLNLVDLLRFNSGKFDKRIWLTTEQTLKIESKYPLIRLQDLCTISRGASPRPINNYITEDSKDGVNWIKIGDVKKNDKYINKTKQKITKEGASKSREVYKGDFILSNSMSFGRPYVLNISGCIHDGWLLLRNFHENLNKDYLYEILSYEDTQKQFTFSAAGGVVKNLNIGRVKITKIPLPPQKIQKLIVEAVKKFDETKNTLLKKHTIDEYELIVKEKRNEIIRSFL